MQHAALDSISSPPKLTGTTFSAVFLSFNPSGQYKKYHALQPAWSGFQRVQEMFACYSQLSLPANRLCLGASNAFPGAAEMISLLNKKFHLYLRRRISARWCVARGFAEHWVKALAHA